MSGLLATGTVSHGADQASADIRVFPAAYFADAQLRTALDLLRRVPGFTLDNGDNDVRGYSGSTGNVLIDGQRPTGKYGRLVDTLKQIPAASVERIELIGGASAGRDSQGQTLVANVVRRVDSTLHASAELGFYAHGDGSIKPEGRLEGLQKSADRLLEGSLQAYEVIDDKSGSGYRQRVDSMNQPVSFARSDLLEIENGIEATLGYERSLANGRFRATAALLAERKNNVEDIATTFPGSEFTSITEDNHSQLAELGAHYERLTGANSKLELLAIQQLRTTDETEKEISGSDIERFDKRSDSGETIIRAAVRTTMGSSRSVEWGAEAAFNFLDSESSGQDNGVPVQLPGANVRVEERRGETFGLVTWALRANMNMELGAAFEVSRITQHGDTKTSKSLSYLKPRVLFAWTPSSINQLRVSLQRNVGQLDFDDYVSSAEFSTGTFDIGNSDLEPHTSWDLVMSWERKVLSDSTVVITYHLARMSDVMDIVPVYIDTDGDGTDEFFEGPGNIGDGTLSEIEIGLNLPLQQFNISGGLLNCNVIYRRTTVSDPLTGKQRKIIDIEQPWEGRISFTQDLPAQRFRWGIGVALGETEPEFRSNEVREKRDGAWYEAFAEFFPAPDWKLRLELQNLSGRENRLTRDRYDAPRDTGTIEAIDIESRQLDPYMRLTVRWDFR